MIEQLLHISKETPLQLFSSAKEWFSHYQEFTKDQETIDKAIIGGFMSQQFSFTFLCGYQAALERMFPGIAPDRLKALCISEANGNHPSSMETSLIDHRISGLKTYVTAGSEAEHLFVLCKTEESVNGRPLLKMVHMPSNASNIEISNVDFPLLREIKHGKLTLTDAKIEESQILEGDGFSDYTRPFRTLEDICVGIACQAMLLRQAFDHQWDAQLRDQLLLNIYTLKNLFSLPPSAQETILLLATADRSFEQIRPEIENHLTKQADSHIHKDWETNKAVLSMGKKLKQLRLSKARNRLFR
ncbi:MAG: hypothetical protein AAF587_25220 [Bacteroidota bacterium]